MLFEQDADTDSEQLPTAGIELIKQFADCCLQKAQDNELLYKQLKQDTLPVLNALPRWPELNSNQRGALLSFAHSLNNDSSVLSPRSLLGQALRHRRWYQVPAIIAGYHGPEPAAHIELRRQEEARLFQVEIRRDSYTVINRSRLLSLAKPALTGQDVRQLQQRLVRRGYEIEVDGSFGPLTQWAVEKFQAAVGLPVTGIADLETQRIIYARDLFMSDPYLIGSDVREVQSALMRMGYAVEITGVFSLRTLQAVTAFQSYFGLPEDGIVRGKTLTKLLYLPTMASVS